MENVSRRSFIKSAAVTGSLAAAAALPTAARAEETPAVTFKHTWEVAPDPITDIAETKDYDVVIVGAGLAGLSAAEAAARNGAKVALLEKSDSYQLRGIDVGHIGSKWQEENGVSIDPRVAARLLFQWSQQTANYNLIYTWASRSGKVFDYIQELADANGVQMVSAISATSKYDWDELPERWRVYPDAVSFTRGDEVGQNKDKRPDDKTVNWNLGDMLADSALANGAEFFYNTPAEQLVGDAASGITGVIATDADGKHVQFNAAQGVILATGDISGNQEMVDAFAPICNRADSFLYTPGGCNTGDGILMGCWAGAGLSKSAAAPMVHQFKANTRSFNLTSFKMTWLAVNRNGERYGADLSFEPYLTNARMNQPGSVAWSIFDADFTTYVQAQWPDKYDFWLDGIDDQMQTALDDGLLIQADTLEELAEKIGVPYEKFQATIDRYNSMYEAGADEDFDVPARFLSQVKNAPFYAVPNVCSVLCIPFGLHVNDDSQVCTEADEPIPGLFAIGNVQGDFFGLAYPVHCPGVSHGRCVTFGQLVGEALAQGKTITETAAE